MSVLALYQPDARSCARLHDALGGEHRLVDCRSWDHLWDVVREERTDGCVVDPYTDGEGVSRTRLRQFRRRFPGLVIIVYADFHGRELDLYHLGRLGVDGVILSRQEQTHRRIRNAIGLALSASLANRIRERLPGVVPPLGVRCVAWAVKHAVECPQVQDLAREVRMSSRALARELRGLGLPSPRQLLLWGRLIQAARMLDDPEITVEDAAFALGYATGASLGRAIKEQTGLSPTELQEAGGVDSAVDAFVELVVQGVQEADREQRWSTSRVRRQVLDSFLGR